MGGKRVWGQWRGEWEGTVVMANTNRINSKTETDLHCTQCVHKGYPTGLYGRETNVHLVNMSNI